MHCHFNGIQSSDMLSGVNIHNTGINFMAKTAYLDIYITITIKNNKKKNKEIALPEILLSLN